MRCVVMTRCLSRLRQVSHFGAGSGGVHGRSSAYPFIDAPIFDERVAGTDGRDVLAPKEPGKAMPAVKDVFWPPIKPTQFSAPLGKQVPEAEDRHLPLQWRCP
jgi:hypothetical protein